MSGAVDPIYVAARATLLDALEALAEHRAAITLVGAQAIYLHAGEADVAVAPYTTDGDLALDPRRLGREPALEAAMKAKGFALRLDLHGNPQVGIWVAEGSVGTDVVTIDLLIPQSLGSAERRGARLDDHDSRAARNVKGLEGCLIDKAPVTIASLASEDTRRFEIAIAGPAALIVSKCHKLADRIAEAGRRRVKPKDAQDVLRLLRAVPTEVLVPGFTRMAADGLSSDVAQRGLAHLHDLFGRPRLLGCDLAVRASEGLEDEATIRASCAALTSDLLSALGRL